MLTLCAYDPKAAYLEYRRNLPHYRQDNVIYYVTMRLYDSLPATKLREWRNHLAYLPEDERATHIARRMERWLDQGHGSCLLAESGVPELLAQTILHCDQQQYMVDEFVIMPNHAHLLIMPLPGQKLTEILKALSSVSSHKINKHLGRTGAIWQTEPFDHIVRDTAALHRFRRYIRGNPTKLRNKQTLLGTGHFSATLGL